MYINSKFFGFWFLHIQKSKKPKIIFADEPTGNLDKDTANIVMNTLFNYIKENDAGLILVTHEEDLAFRCDKVFKLEELNLKEIK